MKELEGQEAYESVAQEVQADEIPQFCPGCGGQLIPEGGCIFCPACGWSACSI